VRDHFLRIDPISAFLDRRDEISDKIQPDEALTVPSGGTVIDSSEIDPSVQGTTVVPAGQFRDKQGRWPTSSYLPGYNSSVASRACPKCGFEAFAWAERCRCGAKLTD
jgi:hypothetical protein